MVVKKTPVKKEFVRVCPQCFSDQIMQWFPQGGDVWRCRECNYDYFSPIEMEKGFDREKLLKKIQKSKK